MKRCLKPRALAASLASLWSLEGRLGEMEVTASALSPKTSRATEARNALSRPPESTMTALPQPLRIASSFSSLGFIPPDLPPKRFEPFTERLLKGLCELTQPFPNVRRIYIPILIQQRLHILQVPGPAGDDL